MEQALVNAKIDNWRQWLPGEQGDSSRRTIQEVALAGLTLLAVCGFVFALQVVLTTSFPSTNGYALLAGALVSAAAFYSIGSLSFGRIQLLGGRGDRVYPLRSGPRENIIAATCGIAASIAVVIACVQLAGVLGLSYSLLLIAGGGVLAILGYFMDSAVMGFVKAGRVLVALLLAFATLVAAVSAHVLGWPLWLLANAFLYVMMVLALPIERVVAPWIRARVRPRPPIGDATALQGAA